MMDFHDPCDHCGEIVSGSIGEGIDTFEATCPHCQHVLLGHVITYVTFDTIPEDEVGWHPKAEQP